MKFTTPQSQRLSFAIIGEQATRASVVRLLGSRRPFTVVRFVVSVVILAFNRVLFARALAHVSKKVLKRVSPTVTNGNTATAIVWVMFVLRIKAPLFHAIKRFIGDGFGHAMCAAVSTIYFRFIASAAFCMTVSKLRNVYNDYFLAIATTPPIGAGILVHSRKTKHVKSVKFLPFNVYESWMGWFGLKGDAIFGVRHVASVKGNLMRLETAFVARLRAVSIVTECWI